MTPEITWILKKFDDLKPAELYSILQMRNEVFVVEQKCIFQDADNKDQPSLHLMGWNGQQLVAYARIVPPGISYPEPSIGRVITSPASRKNGTGKTLMLQAIQATESVHGKNIIRIGAQFYLKKFYESFGFIAEGDVYLEDDIDHIIMVRHTAV